TARRTSVVRRAVTASKANKCAGVSGVGSGCTDSGGGVGRSSGGRGQPPPGSVTVTATVPDEPLNVPVTPPNVAVTVTVPTSQPEVSLTVSDAFPLDPTVPVPRVPVLVENVTVPLLGSAPGPLRATVASRTTAVPAPWTTLAGVAVTVVVVLAAGALTVRFTAELVEPEKSAVPPKV